MSDLRPIGVFDSGVGGLTVVRELEKILPHERIVYFGDTARVPYGTKSKETITRFSVENVEILMRHNVKIVIVACNTASSLSLDFLKRCFRVPIIGVIEPGAKRAVSVTRSNRIGVIGTQATIASGAYDRAVRAITAKVTVTSQSCPLFVPLVEEGWLTGAVTREVAAIYLRAIAKKRIDTLVLGCTHYPLLKKIIQDVVGKKVMLVDSACEIAKEARAILDANGLLNRQAARPAHIFLVSDQPERFRRMGERFLGKKITCSKQAG